MLGHPVAMESETLGDARQLRAVAQRLSTARAAGDGREVEDGKPGAGSICHVNDNRARGPLVPARTHHGVVHPAVNAPEQVRAVLTAAARDAAEQLAAITRQLASVVEASAGDEHDPEGATIAFERAQLGFLREQAVTRGNEIDLALARLEAGSYGVCVRCGNPISRERLDARPASATCIACASR